MWPFTHFNRLHILPPLTIDEADLRAGLAVVDESLVVADAHAARQTATD